MKVRKVLMVVAASMLAFGATQILASPAQAAEIHEKMSTDDKAPGGTVEFWADGDVVKLCDVEADGFGAYLSVVDVDASPDSTRYTYFMGGNGHCIELRASLGGKYDLAEGHIFRFTICLQKNDVNSYCDEAYWINQN